MRNETKQNNNENKTRKENQNEKKWDESKRDRKSQVNIASQQIQNKYA